MKKYCHFLNEKGLCRLVLEKGPKFLCQICRDHPRFYVYSCNEYLTMEDTLAGTGLACEETVEQLMAEEGKSFLKGMTAPSPSISMTSSAPTS